MKEQMLAQIVYDCPICHHIHPVEHRVRATQALFKTEVIDYQEEYLCCTESNEDENEFVPAKMMDENLLRVRDAYRSNHGLLTAKEISQIRGQYGLTQSEFAALLGWGEVTVTRYETKNIQDETYDSMMRLVRDNPMFALDCLQRHECRFFTSRYEAIKDTIAKRVEKEGSQYLRVQEIESRYVKYRDLDEMNGYKALDIPKLSCVMWYFAKHVKSLYKVKLMKLLWYTDSLYYKRHGRSMTGLVYTHMPYGALPVAFQEIMELPTLKVVEELVNEDTRYHILPFGKLNENVFQHDELSVLKEVSDKFRSLNTSQMVAYMHLEKAYLATKDRQVIPYGLASELRELQ